jgi:DNA-binding MarR family transcriptional regulator
MSNLPQFNPDLTILEQIEQNPDATQATLASQMNVAVGTINWHLKRLIEKGYVKVHRLERKKLRYIITPEGIALRARLTVDYIQTSLDIYRTVRRRVLAALDKVKEAGYRAVRVVGEGDVAEICRLTCLEQGVTVVEDTDDPALVINYLKVTVEWKEN